MIRTKVILGLALAASIASLAPAADAAPIAVSRAAVTISPNGPVMLEMTRISMKRRAERRTVRHAVKH